MTLQFYALCLSSFRADINHGTWITASDNFEIINQEINDMLATSPFEDANEWRISRFDSPMGECDFLHDQIELEQLHDMAVLLEDYGDRAAVLLKQFHGHVPAVKDALRKSEQRV